MKTNPDKIRKIVENLAFNDSEEALRDLYDYYSDRISRYIYLYVKSGEIVNELVSDLFVALWDNRRYLLEVENVNAYIYRIAKFKSLNYLRDNKTALVSIDELSIDLFTQTRTTPEDCLISIETINAINEAIEQLPPRCKLAFKLVREDNMKYKDAANHLGISVKTLEAHLGMAVKKIRVILDQRNK